MHQEIHTSGPCLGYMDFFNIYFLLNLLYKFYFQFATCVSNIFNLISDSLGLSPYRYILNMLIYPCPNFSDLASNAENSILKIAIPFHTHLYLLSYTLHQELLLMLNLIHNSLTLTDQF